MSEFDRGLSPARRTLLIVLAATFVYASVRYNVFGDVPWSQLPLYVSNKAISWTAVTLLALAYLSRGKQFASECGVLGLLLAIAHVLMTPPIQSPAYYNKFYAGQHLTVTIEASLLAGVIAVIVLVFPGVASIPGVRASIGEERWLRWLRAGYWALALTALHCALQGWSGWFTPAKWPGYMPPITLIATLTALAPIVVKLRR